MSSSILKFYTTNKKEESKVIDSNALMDIKLQQIMAKAQAAENDQPEDDEAAGGDGSDGFEGLSITDLDRLTADSAEGRPVVKADAEAILKEAQEKADEIVANAEQLAEEYKENSRREAEIEGSRIRNNARQEGYDAGIRQAQDEYAARMQAVDMRQQQLEADYQETIAQLEPQFIETLTDIYEHIFKVDLSEYQDIVMQLITDTIYKSDNSHSYIVHVSPDDYSQMGPQQREILTSAAAGAKVDVVEDIGLSKNQCLLETDNGLLDCSLDTQLRALKRKLVLLSYTPGSENY